MSDNHVDLQRFVMVGAALFTLIIMFVWCTKTSTSATPIPYPGNNYDIDAPWPLVEFAIVFVQLASVVGIAFIGVIALDMIGSWLELQLRRILR